MAGEQCVHLSTVSTQVSHGLSQPTQTPFSITFESTHRHSFVLVRTPLQFASPSSRHYVHCLSFVHSEQPNLQGRQVFVLVCPKYFTPATSGHEAASTHKPSVGSFKNLPGLHSRQWVLAPEAHVRQSAAH